MEESNQAKLIEELLKLSESKDWAYAKLEWKYYHAFEKENNCLCGHFIFENCIIKNIHNGNKAIVGNSCVLKFLEMDNKGIFAGLKKIKKDISKSVTKRLIEHSYEEMVLNSKEYNFYSDIYRKRKLTQKQLSYKVSLNKRIFNHFKEGKK